MKRLFNDLPVKGLVNFGIVIWNVYVVFRDHVHAACHDVEVHNIIGQVRSHKVICPDCKHVIGCFGGLKVKEESFHVGVGLGIRHELLEILGQRPKD